MPGPWRSSRTRDSTPWWAGAPLEIYPFLGATRLASPIDQLRPDFAIHGHAHRGVLRGATQGGVPVYNVALPVLRRLEKPLGYLTIDL
ncbi:MAG TPA: metallophosphoesterase family protein [Myxococcales bacterium]